MTSLLKFRPIYQARVWGGRRLEGFLSRSLPGSGPIGESWEIVDRPEAQSVVSEGARQGMSLGDLMTHHHSWMMGPNWPKERRFPILVKWLDCRERLSLQVHPPASVAARLGGEPKTENWYIADAQPGAAVLAGLKDGVSVERFRSALENNTAESLVHKLPTRAGDSLLIRSGVMHAIDAGNLILEIQQNSDTTYRVYDWGRVGLDGQPRAMHVEESMASIGANTADAPKLVRSAETRLVLADCAEFRIERVTLGDGKGLRLNAGEGARILSVVEGCVRANAGEYRRGDNVLVPYAADVLIQSVGAAVFLITDRFSSLEK